MGSSGSPLASLAEAQDVAGTVAMTWLGQAGFGIRAAGTTALVDPFLAPYEGRRYESALRPEDAAGLDVVLCTHEHVDHFDAVSAPAFAKASPGCVFVVPTPIVDMVTEVGIAGDRVIGMQPGDVQKIGGFSLRAVPAMHGVTMDDAYGFGEELSDGQVRFLGYVVEADGIRVFHAGDTIPYDGMDVLLGELDLDVALLPINGRDADREGRGIVGNMSEREAAWLADEIGVGTLVPMHHDLFAANRGWPAHVVEAVEREDRDVAVLVPPRERPFRVTARQAR